MEWRKNKMQNKNMRGIVALAVVTCLSFGVICGSKALSTPTGQVSEQNVAVLQELDVTGVEFVEKAIKTEDGYTVAVRTKGYGGDILLEVSFDEAAEKVTKVVVLEQTETDGVGSKITEAEFLSQFEGMVAPVYLAGMDLGNTSGQATGAFKDGTYVAKTQEADDNGFIEEVTMIVEKGAITSVVWDCVKEDGTKKSVLSENGQYVMTEDGLTWKEQAEALAAAVVASQGVEGVQMNESYKTDAITGVSIYVGGFVGLVEQCLADATATPTLQDGTYVAKTQEADDNGFIEEVTMVVEKGAITSVVWDCVKEDGTKKSVLSENGQYVMTEDGLTWKEQAEALAAAVVASQGVEGVQMNESYKTDAITGVSIYVGGFVGLVEQCLADAAGTVAQTVEGTQVDAISGATVSSKAVVTAINYAFEFLKSVQ